MPPSRIRCCPSSSAIESRQCEQWPRRTGVSRAPLNIVADKGAGDVLQTAMRHATHPPPVKTFRTTVAVPVCHDDGVRHVPPFVFLGTALGNYQVQRMQFLGTKDRINDESFYLSGNVRKNSELYHRILCWK